MRWIVSAAGRVTQSFMNPILLRSGGYTPGMDADLKALVDSTGMCVPLAAGMVRLILTSGASDMEARAAMKIVDAVLVTLPVSSRSASLQRPGPD